MKRRAIDDLIQWKNSNSGKLFLFTGAKGVGKTYLAYDFARAFFERIFYINFEREAGVNMIFQTRGKDDDVVNSIINYLTSDQNSFTESNVLILDEIYLTPDSVYNLTLLKDSGYFRYIICLSSGPVSKEIKGFFCHKQLFPMEFDEFLLATGNEWYIETIQTHFGTNKPIPDIVHKELLDLFRLYMQIGGMPGIINEYLSFNSLVNVPEQHGLLIGAWHDYIQKKYPEGEAMRMNQVFDSLVLQLMKENKKFQYKLIRKGTTHSMYKDAISQLLDRNYIIRSTKISTEQLKKSRLEFYGDISNNASGDTVNARDAVNASGDTINVPDDTVDALYDFSQEEGNTNFKLYMPDTGMLYTKIVEEQGITSNGQTDKALLENFVAQSLQRKGYRLYFWESESMAKMDFLIRQKDTYLPIEVHCSDNTRSKSISVLKQIYDFPYAIKISSRNFELSNQVKYVPYYAIFCLK